MEALERCRNLIDFFNEFVLRHTEQMFDIALKIIRKDLVEDLTFNELLSGSEKFAGYLIQEREIRIGDRIAILGKNCVNWDIAFWGAILAGTIPVLIDPERKAEGVKKHLSHTEAELLVMANDYQDEPSREELRRFIPTIKMTVFPKIDFKTFRKRLCWIKNIKNVISPDKTAVILCTSGTTEDPREVELSHQNLLSNLKGALEIVKIRPQDRLGHILPPHHSFGLTVGKLLPLCVGATNIYTDSYRHIAQFIKEEEVTIFIAVPALFVAIAKKIRYGLTQIQAKSGIVRLLNRVAPKMIGKILLRKLGWANLRFLVSGSAPMSKWVLETFWRLGIELREGYGTTENSPVYGFNTSPKKLGSVGKPISTLLVKIAPDGEILLGGPCIAKGYHNNPEATKKTFETDPNGIRWVHTGDLGHLDQDGDLFITGRKKYLIVLPGGKKVHPEHLELVLSGAKYVKDILIVPDRQNQEEYVKAIVFPNLEEIGPERNIEVIKKLVWESINNLQQKSKELSSFERVKTLEITMEEFEKTSNGKIKRDSYLPRPATL